jgi:hypothetical protein
MSKLNVADAAAAIDHTVSSNADGAINEGD